MIEFEVIDNRTGNSPDCETIALTEEWAKHLIYCDIDCFAITEDGDLILIDDCNNVACPPSDRFTVKVDPESLRPKGTWIVIDDDYTWDEVMDDEQYVVLECECPFCGERTKKDRPNYCDNCGARMEG